jgi:hypothetical protein
MRRIEPSSDSSTISPSRRDRVWVDRAMEVGMPDTLVRAAAVVVDVGRNPDYRVAPRCTVFP